MASLVAFEIGAFLLYSLKRRNLLLEQYDILDAHCDTVHFFTGERGCYNFASRNEHAQLDLPRMEEGGVKVQFFAIYIDPPYASCRALQRCLQLLDSYFVTVERYHQRIETVYSYNDITSVISSGKIAGFLTVEGGEALEGDLSILRMLYRLGVRGLGLTWNGRNDLADGVWEEKSGGGLTRFGRTVVKEMNRLGMIIDLAHISPSGFRDVLELTDAPVIVSHANAAALCSHPRNLSDKQLKGLRDNGGVIGLNFYPPFISNEEPNLDKLLDHFSYIADMVGVEYLGIGSDFDGVNQRLLELGDASLLPRLAEGLQQRGFTAKEIEKIMFRNFLRVIRTVLKAL